MATDTLAGRTIAFLATDGVEEVELTEPWRATQEAGATPRLVALRPGTIRSFEHLDPSGEHPVDLTVEEARADDFDGLVIPGGVANPDELRTDERAVAFVRDVVTSGKPVGVICHGPWVLAEAGVASGRRLTSWPSLRTDLRNAGADWVDEEVVVDQGLVTSRRPDDLPAFCAKLVEELAEGRHEERAAAAAGRS